MALIADANGAQVQVLDRFWSKVDRTSGPDACWPWIAGHNRKGYGEFKVAGLRVLSHRFAAGAADGQVVRHRCDSPSCCNPAHLSVGTQAENVADMMAKGRHVAPAGERHGNSKLTASDVAAIRSAKAAGESTLVIARRFGISPGNVWNITRGGAWRQ